MTRALSHFLVIALITSVSGACSPIEKAAGDDTTSFTGDFTSEEKRIARALSIGGNDIRKAHPPQYSAILCSLALAAIEERMQSADLLSAQQQHAFAQAKELYRNRAVAGISQEEFERTQADVENAYPDERDRSRFAIGCLRDLSST